MRNCTIVRIDRFFRIVFHFRVVGFVPLGVARFCITIFVVEPVFVSVLTKMFAAEYPCHKFNISPEQRVFQLCSWVSSWCYCFRGGDESGKTLSRTFVQIREKIVLRVVEAEEFDVGVVYRHL